MSRKYYANRTGKNPEASRYELPRFVELFKAVYLDFLKNDYFYENSGDVPGKLGSDIEAQMFIKLKKPDLWPIEEKCNNYSEDDLFDVIEFLYDRVSQPIHGYDEWSNHGDSYDTFDRETGKQEFRDSMNQLLRDYREGYELSENGEILESPEQGLEELVIEKLPPHAPENVEQRVESAILKFRRSRSSLDGKRDAIRDLADVLEFLRDQNKELKLNATEGALFNMAKDNLFIIANKYGIRHHNKNQHQDYDKAIWYNWMFYDSLATIHAWVRLIKKAESQSP
ncbi:hypothetical protein QUA54_23540 [Microcoleus sp. MOSTC5]|uniref:hypothetical protein n=1 Tax=Microcoleus sp. MOSTC5 TaxID=3055378 RepID=UPI002FD20C2A